MSTEDRLVQKAEALVDSIDFDNNGVMVGNVFRGGNGGMISLKTIRTADELRKALDAYKRKEGAMSLVYLTLTPIPGCSPQGAITDAVLMAQRLQCSVSITIDGIPVYITPDDSGSYVPYQKWKERHDLASQMPLPND